MLQNGACSQKQLSHAEQRLVGNRIQVLQYIEGRVRSDKAISHSSAWSISIEMLPLRIEFRPLNPRT